MNDAIQVFLDALSVLAEGNAILPPEWEDCRPAMIEAAVNASAGLRAMISRLELLEAYRLALESLYLAVRPSDDPTFPSSREMEDVVGEQVIRAKQLDAYLDGRGLPRGWTGPLDAWGWVLCDRDGYVCGYDHEVDGQRPPAGDWKTCYRWDSDWITAGDRAAARKLEEG